MITNALYLAGIVPPLICSRGPYPCYKAWKAAEQAWRKSLPPIPPSVMTDPAHPEDKTPAFLPASYTTAFHGTSLDSVRDQIVNGKFEPRGTWVYLTHNPHQASWYTLNKKDGVILELFYNGDKTDIHPLFNTLRMMPGDKPENTVYIRRVVQINPAFSEARAKHYPPRLQKWATIAKIAERMLQAERK